MELIKAVEETREYIMGKVNEKPEIGIVLGSGLGELADKIEEAVKLDYKDIPGFPLSTVEGHEGALIFGKLEGKSVVVMKGRFHFYEGYDTKAVTFPVRVMKSLGVETLIITNAAGGINRAFSAGDFMIINDHINMGYNNPLLGKNYSELGDRFPDMSEAYDKELIALAKSSADRVGVGVKDGVYVYVLGPSYETPAEVRMLSLLGADAVGMSTVPEVIVARHGKMKVLGISCITNMAAGILNAPLNHEEVMETGNRVKSQFEALVRDIVKSI